MSSDPPQPPFLRPILPRTEPLPRRPPIRNLPPRRPLVLVACEGCRKVRTKCNGARPSCSACVGKNRKCIYRAEAGESSDAALRRKNRETEEELRKLRGSHDALRRVVTALQTCKDDEVAAILRRLRETQDATAVATQLEGGDLLLQLHVAPETTFRFSFPYCRDMPRALLRPDNPYLGSVLYESAFTSASNQSSAMISRIERLQPQYVKPYTAALIADTRLGTVNVARWTNVCADNAILRHLLHIYLLSEYQLFPPFHKDYFINDMVLGSTRFCTSLLVNAVLALACSCDPELSDRAEYWNPRALSYKFFAEARGLWDLERLSPNSVTTVQAGIVINTIYNMYSMDRIGLTYGVQAAAIAQEMGMFDADRGTLDKSQRIVQGFTAWAFFQCYHFLIPCPITDQPATTFPDPDEEPQWYGEFLFQYPSNQTLVRLNYPQWTWFKFRLLQIIRPVASELFEKEEKSSIAQQHVLFSETISRLKNLYAALPASLLPSQIVFPLHMGLHLWYHNIMINILQLLAPEVASEVASEVALEAAPEAGARLSSEMHGDVEAQLVYSRICFETIMRLYYLRNGYEGSDMILVHFLTVLSFMALGGNTGNSNPGAGAATSQEETRSTLILTAKGLYEQGNNFFVSVTILHVLRIQMAAEDVDILGQYCAAVSDDPGQKKARALYSRAQYPLNIVKMTDTPENQRLENMIKKYEKLGVEQTSQA
ncbi:nitrate assimilation regulatory protein nirA [Beauveria bassiana ARSEF 2860]|uniref:Nitrate assimilation regulatory protein nirA n=1 Tax=Beauveria bassiana (strain ARSEF 2860) TaxID=655819 RepID=J5K8K0_BEAB2|nr:nitrate assimilation regulatory protein nirA [Beauveria bassiana ARSEF 2860]EJP70441.1 nitrate assimilation regulatory protein nirA [Beauveria bassiana ARSEF 2860]